MARKVNQFLWDQWRQRIRRQRASGMPIAVFCRKEGVSQAAFHAWKRKLHRSASARTAPPESVVPQHVRKRSTPLSQRRRPQNSAASPATPTHSADFLQVPVRGLPSSPWIELSLVDGTLVRVPQENLAALTTLLRVLRGDGFPTLAGEARHA